MKEVKFNKEYDWSDDKVKDKRLINLLNAIQSLLGIDISCVGQYNTQNLIIFFKSTLPQGLFFLTRCIDRRYYWVSDKLWKIELSIGDQFINNYLPVTYELNTNGIIGEDSYVMCEDLLKNLTYHLNHENFMKGFKLNIKEFEIYTDLEIRNLKIKKIIKNGKNTL